MTEQQDGGRLTGASLAKDLFEDMGRKVEGMGGLADGESSEPKVVDEVESLCMNCHADGTTRLLLTKIPYFREIIITSFYCQECHFKNSEIQSAGSIQEKGAKYALRIENDRDLQRQVVKTDHCVFRIEDIDLEVPSGRGQYTNVEGIISTVKEDLESQQAERMRQMPEIGAQVAAVIRKLADMLEGRSFPFAVSADDMTGNSWIEPQPNDGVGKWAKSEYNRTPAQNSTLGLGEEAEQVASEAPETNIRPEYHSANLTGGREAPATGAEMPSNVDQEDIVENQVYSFPATCPGCTRPCTTNMKMVNIPYFKQVVLMSTVCHDCGYRSNEVKTGGEVPEKGRKITLHVENSEDLARDVLKSESAALHCPELQLRVEPGTLGGRFTTAEGLLTQIRRDLRAQAFGLEDGDAEVERAGDGMAPESKRTWEEFFGGLTEAIEGKRKFTIVLEDPLASSYIQSFTAPAPDPQIEIEDYERSEQEMEDLGLNDMKTEGYEEDGQ
ncbi:hypothetical protein MBLNU230_g3027t1 [Neophaeotheca triangularis]